MLAGDGTRFLGFALLWPSRFGLRLQPRAPGLVVRIAESGSRSYCTFYHFLDHFDRAARLRFRRGSLIYLFMTSSCSSADPWRIAVLDLVLARHQQRKDFEVARCLLPCDLLNRLFAVVSEVQQQRLDELLI